MSSQVLKQKQMLPLAFVTCGESDCHKGDLINHLRETPAFPARD
jgi:hypothetical protein